MIPLKAISFLIAALVVGGLSGCGTVQKQLKPDQIKTIKISQDVVFGGNLYPKGSLHRLIEFENGQRAVVLSSFINSTGSVATVQGAPMFIPLSVSVTEGVTIGSDNCTDGGRAYHDAMFDDWRTQPPDHIGSKNTFERYTPKRFCFE
jgi:hypothetical protein